MEHINLIETNNIVVMRKAGKICCLKEKMHNIDENYRLRTNKPQEVLTFSQSAVVCSISNLSLTTVITHRRISLRSLSQATCSACSPEGTSAAWFPEAVAGPLKSGAAAVAAGDGTADAAAVCHPLQLFLGTAFGDVPVLFTMFAFRKPLFCSMQP